MNPLFTYLDYQEYLRDYCRGRKRETSFFTYRYMGRKLGLDPGFPGLVMGNMHDTLVRV